MILSMTGYAAASRDVGPARLSVELKSVNSRFLDLLFRMPDELRALEPALREIFGAALTRGKVECRINLAPVETAGARPAQLDGALLGQLRTWQAEVRVALPDAPALSVAEVLRWPGVLAEAVAAAEDLRAQGLALAEDTLRELLAARRREGERLAAMILERVQRMRALVEEVAPRLPQAIADYQAKLTARLREAAASLDEDRIRQEVGVFAQRVDVAEELTRLSAHLHEVERTLAKGGAAGKRLDFLMQELNRESNTLSSKSVSGEVTAVALELKLLTEQMREQVQNIE